MDRKRLLMGNNNGGNLAQMLLSGAALRLDNITHSAIPVAGAVTPSMTRSTTATCVDSWGRQITALAGEVRFPGARRIYNLLATVANVASNNFTTSGWQTFASASKTSENVITISGANSGVYFSGTPSGGSRQYVIRCTISGTAGNKINVCWSDSATSAKGFGQQITLSATPTPITISGSVSAAVENYGLSFENRNILGLGAATSNIGAVTITNIQVEDVTGQSVQTAGEYVSVGVESAPAYHGSMVDGVKCFPYDLSGNPLTGMSTPLIELATTNYCLFSNTLSSWSDVGTPAATQDAVGPNGQANYAWTLTDNNPAGYEAKALGSITFTAGQNGCFSALVEKKTASPTYPLLLLNHNVTGGIFSGVIVNEVAGTIVNIPAGGQYATPLTSGISSYNDGVKDYWLVWVSATQAGASATAGLQLYPSGSVDGTTLSATAQGSTVFCDAQFEIGVTFPSSRIATAAAPVARSADQFYYTGALIGQLKSLATRGFKRDAGFTNTAAILAISDGTINNYQETSITGATSFGFSAGVSGVAQWVQGASNAYTPGSLSNSAWSATTNDIKMAKDGVGQTPDTSATIPTVNRLEPGNVGGVFQLNGYPGKIYGWTRNLSQSELNGVSA